MENIYVNNTEEEESDYEDFWNQREDPYKKRAREQAEADAAKKQAEALKKDQQPVQVIEIKSSPTIQKRKGRPKKTVRFNEADSIIPKGQIEIVRAKTKKTTRKRKTDFVEAIPRKKSKSNGGHAVEPTLGAPPIQSMETSPIATNENEVIEIKSREENQDNRYKMRTREERRGPALFALEYVKRFIGKKPKMPKDDKKLAMTMAKNHKRENKKIAKAHASRVKSAKLMAKSLANNIDKEKIATFEDDGRISKIDQITCQPKISIFY